MGSETFATQTCFHKNITSFAAGRQNRQAGNCRAPRAMVTIATAGDGRETAIAPVGLKLPTRRISTALAIAVAGADASQQGTVFFGQ